MAARLTSSPLLRLVLLLANAGLCQAATQQALEYQVKAAFLLNFTKFVEWPPDVFAAPDAPIVICIHGENPFGATLDQIVQGESVDGHKIVVQIGAPETPKPCHILFVTQAEKEAAQQLENFPHGVLTVGQEESFLRYGGMINFVIENRRVRFDVNMRAVQNSGLKLSSKLLGVARRVER